MTAQVLKYTLWLRRPDRRAFKSQHLHDGTGYFDLADPGAAALAIDELISQFGRPDLGRAAHKFDFTDTATGETISDFTPTDAPLPAPRAPVDGRMLTMPLAAGDERNPLAGFSDEALVRELLRRMRALRAR